MSVDEIKSKYRNFNIAMVDRVDIGPRREATLFLTPLLWQENLGQYGSLLAVRFGGIENFSAVSNRFQEIVSQNSEIGYLGPDPENPNRHNGLHQFIYCAERTDFEFRFQCRNVDIKKANGLAK